MADNFDRTMSMLYALTFHQSLPKIKPRSLHTHSKAMDMWLDSKSNYLLNYWIDQMKTYLKNNKPSNMNYNKLTLENKTYDLVLVHTPTFMIQHKLPLVIIKESKNGVYTYESVKIGNHYFAMVPFEDKPFTEDLLKQKGWIFQEIVGQDKLYHKGFDGRAWFTLFFEGDGYVTITRVRKEGQEKLVKFQGAVYNEKDFDNICKFFNL